MAVGLGLAPVPVLENPPDGLALLGEIRLLKLPLPLLVVVVSGRVVTRLLMNSDCRVYRLGVRRLAGPLEGSPP